jgi:uncharacterized membrane protein YhaH (DUF805 family)
MGWFILAWTIAAEFTGRSRRKEYWMFQLFNILVGVAIAMGALLIGGKAGLNTFAFSLCAYGMVSFVPSLSCMVRRLHDTGRSCWWYFIGFVPLIGGIVLMVFMVLDSDPDRNEYGPNPKLPEPPGVIV